MKRSSVLVPHRLLHRRFDRTRRGVLDRRRLQSEPLEQRDLLAVGPQLIAVQPNSGDVLRDGIVRHIAPQQLTFVFDESQQIDPSTLAGIRITRAGFDNAFDGVSDLIVQPGYIGVDEDRLNRVIVRFAETLPDDLYRIEVFAVDNSAQNLKALRNIKGDPFQPATPGADRTSLNFELDLGAQVLAIVPQPVRREGTSLVQARNQIEVYFNNDNLNVASATNPAFYRLYYTASTVANTDDAIVRPTRVDYDATTDKAVLTFASDLDSLATGAGTYRLRIGTDEALPVVPTFTDVAQDPGSSFSTSRDLGVLDKAQIVSSAIDVEEYPLNYPGSVTEPGHRDINEVENHYSGIGYAAPDEIPGITVQPYNFRLNYGNDPQGRPLVNLITDQQKQRAREIFEQYEQYLGIVFLETADQGLTIATGDLRVLDPSVPTGPGGVLGIAGDANPSPTIYWPTAIMDAGELWDDRFGETLDVGRQSWYETAMHEIGHLLGLGHTYDLPARTVMGDEADLNFLGRPEPVFPGDNDIVHGQNIHRPEGNDIDLYRFHLDSPGEMTAEIIAERRNDSSQLDAVLTLYKVNNGVPTMIARNDDYFSEDSFIGLDLDAGDYYLAVTSTGNVQFDPTIERTGLGGTTQGEYDLRLDFQPRVDNYLVDTTGTALDGDADGTPGGEYNFWFRVEDESRTTFVDKAAPAGGDGTIAKPFNNLRTALTSNRVAAGGIVRLVGNGGGDGLVNTLGDNLAYELGINEGRTLNDGLNLLVPRNVTLMIDGGAVFKMLKANVHVGSSSVTIDRSGSALQVLGTPQAKVVFTSYDDQTIGVDTNPRQTTPDPGDWGGLIFQNDADRAEGRGDYEQQGAFMNFVNGADIRYGGGNVLIDSVQQVINPIHLVDARPTIRNNEISFSADAAISANPDSFEETNYTAPDSLKVDYQATPFTSDYDRVGPDVRSNRLLNNSINGLFVRIATPAGGQLERLTVAGRFDDTDIVHVVSENLVIQGTPGGPIQEIGGTRLIARTDAQLKVDPGIIVKLDGARIELGVGAQLLAEGDPGREVVFTSLLDQRFGAAGTFATNPPSSGSSDPPAPGDWSGIYVGAAARASIDQAILTYAGGISRVEGSFANFNAIEVHQGVLRLTNSALAHNQNGRGGQSELTRGGRGTNGEGAIFVRGAQPIVVNNVIKDTAGYLSPVININANAMNYQLVTDYGRSTGLIGGFAQFVDNRGPLVRLNRIGNNSLNGMAIRGGTLTTESVWDDTDIVHIVFDEIVVPNLHTFGGLRLVSSAAESLVVKFAGANAGLKASGTLSDIDDRIGGMLYILGQPGHPVVMTALNDDSVGAGFDPNGRPQTDTDGVRRAKATQKAGSFQVDLNYGPLLRARPQYVAAMELASRFWERWVEDDVTVTLDMEIDPALLSTGTLGAASAQFVSADWDVVRQQMIDDGRANEIAVLQQMPLFDDASFKVPKDTINPFTITRDIQLTRANAKALGIDLTPFPGVASPYDPTEISDGSIVFAPNPWDIAASGDPSFFDMTREDGILPGFVDLVGVAIHEIGHALGWVSSVDTIDTALNDPASFRQIALSAMDMFRLEPGDGQTVGFHDAVRVADPSLDHVFHDGGTYDPYGLNVPNLRLGDIPLSTGADNGDGGQASHWKDVALSIGIMDPTAPNTEAWFSEADRTGFDLIGWDVIGSPVAGDWRGVTLEQYSQDRNVGVVTELEDPALPAPGTNAIPGTAQVLGRLGRAESTSDETLRLGFTIYGAISQPNDVDVYSFEATAGTEIWLDIDRTSNKLDSVVELVDANGTLLARSDNSLAESEGAGSRVGNGVFVADLQKSIFYDGDFGSTNVKDAGLRLVLPGSPGSVGTYHVRVRSSSEELAVISGGLTSGVYELEMRLNEVDEYGGSTVQYADIRYAMSGITLNGLPSHSPLTGEIAEDVWEDGSGRLIDNNDKLPVGNAIARAQGVSLQSDSRVLIRPTIGPLGDNPTLPQFGLDSFQDAQFIGNIMQSDRGALSIGGKLDANSRQETGLVDTVDWYLFEVRFASTQQPGGNTAELTFDLDYADGLSRADTTLAIYRTNFVSTSNPSGAEVQAGTLIYHSQNGGGADDHAAPLQGSDLDDLGRGSVGQLDPFVGPISLPEGYYLLQVTSAQVTQFERLQYTTKLAPNPLARFEPVESVARIAEDRIAEPITDPGKGTTFDPPQVPALLDPTKAIVPYSLGDVELFVSSANAISSVDPFTGTREVAFGTLTGFGAAGAILPQIGDIALRDNPLFNPTSTDPNAARAQRLMSFANDLGIGANPSDATLGNYIYIDVTEETSQERPGSPLPPAAVAVKGVGDQGALTDDLAQTFGADPASADPANPESIATNQGLLYDAIVFDSNSPDVSEGYAIARRIQFQIPGATTAVPAVNNILVKFNAVNGAVISSTGAPQDPAERLPVPNPVPRPAPALPVRQPNAGLDIVEQGVLNTNLPDGTKGGNITGIALLGGTMYGVTDQGHLFRISGHAGQGASARYIATIKLPNADPTLPEDPVKFGGLTAGPSAVEAGAYRNLLFGIDRSGTLVAFDNTGALQPVFTNGQTSVKTGVGGATGLAFGKLDKNLWHVTQQRGGDDGHGRLFPTPQGGGASFYFGEEVNPGGGAARLYDHLGGAHGSLVTNTFSLAGYDVQNDPYIYFTYYLVTEEGAGRDTFRVFVSDDSRTDDRGQWHLVASNQQAEVGPGALDFSARDDINIDVQPLFDNSWQDVPFIRATNPGPNGERDPFPYRDDERPFDPGNHPWTDFGPQLNETLGVWRQARISLKDFAGSDKLRIRFDFSTAGSFDMGKTGGVELRALPGKQLNDGDTFQIDDKTFEFDLGYTLVAPSGRHLVDGETFTVTSPAGRATYEMDSDGSVRAGNKPITYLAGDSAQVVADAIFAAIKADGLADVAIYQNTNHLNLAGATNLAVSGNGGLTIVGALGATGIPISINAGMSADKVAEAMRQPLADTLANGVLSAIKLNRDTLRVYSHTLTDAGPLGSTARLPGDSVGSFGLPVRAKNTPENNGRNDERLYAFTDPANNFTVPFEGVYVDDLIVGFAGFGERGADLRRDYRHEPVTGYETIPNVFEYDGGEVSQTPPPPGAIVTGEYQVEIRRAADYSNGTSPFRTFDPRTRLSSAVSLKIPSGADLVDGQSFFISDGQNRLTIEFDETALGNGVTAGNISVPFAVSDAAWTVLESLRDTINTLYLNKRINVSAAGSNGAVTGSVDTTDRLDLFGSTVVAGGDLETLISDELGSQNRMRDQGQIIIQGNSISNSALYGVVVQDALRDFPCKPGLDSDFSASFCRGLTFDPADEINHSQGSAGDYTPSFGAPRNLREINQDALAPSIVIANNTISFGGEGGIKFSGDASGHTVIAPIGGPDGLSEVWDGDDLHFLVHITDNNGTSQLFEFQTGGNVPLDFVDIPISWSTTNDCPANYGISQCGPRYEADDPDMAEAILTAIGRSNLDITPFRTKGDELYLEGARQIWSIIVRGRPDSVSFAGDNWFYPFNIMPQQSVVPFGRIVNNTIVGLGGTLGGDNLYNDDDFTDIGIQVADYADPTILNNVVVNFHTGIQVDMTSTTTVVGGTVYQGNVDNTRNTNVGDFAIELPNDAPVFVDWERGNFYPAPLSRVIDSSIDSLEERSELVTVKEPMGLARSPILAPNFDALGQLRIDDPTVEPPEGFGKNVFKDRGAIDRVDFLGPIAQFVSPRDNDGAGTDTNPAQDQVRVDNDTLTSFVLQLVDLGEATAPTGTGIDDQVITSDQVIVRRDGQVLTPGVDYRFDYQPTTNQILLSPQAGVWLSGYNYEIQLINQDTFLVSPGSVVADGTTIRFTDAAGTTRTFEFESGYSLRVPETLTVRVPVGTSGLSAVADGEIFTISNGLRLVTFEFDSNNTIGAGRVRVPFQPSSTPDEVANAIVTAINAANLGLAPQFLGTGLVHIGGPFSTILDTSVTALEQFGQGGVYVDGQTLTIRNGATTVGFELDSDGTVSANRVAIPFTDNMTRRELMVALQTAINNATNLRLTAGIGPDGQVILGGDANVSVDVESSNLVLQGSPGVRTNGARPIAYRPTESMTQADLSRLLQAALVANGLDGLTTGIDEAGRLVVLGAADVRGLTTQFIAGVRDIAGNRLRTNQDVSPYSTIMTVELPAPLDFGDAPDDTYPTTLGNDGARHVVVPNIYLGLGLDAELDAHHNADGTGDLFDDGVTFAGPLTPNGRTSIVVTASTEGFLDGWIDANRDGTFDATSERVFANVRLNRGANSLRMAVPATAGIGTTFARFRFSTSGGLLPTGRADNGEVEDYQVTLVAIAPPVATNDTFDLDEDTELQINAANGLLKNDNDPSGGQISAELVGAPAHGTVTVNADGSFTYQPAADFSGTDSFTYRVNTAVLASSLATVTMTVNGLPDPPIAGADSANTDEDVPVTIDLVANDNDPDGALSRSSVVIVRSPAKGTVVVDANGKARYTPQSNYFGQDTFTYSVSDLEGAISNVAEVTVTMGSVNDVPIANADRIFVRQGGSATFDLLKNDVDVDGTLSRQSVVITFSPKSGTIRFNTDGSIVFTPDSTFQGGDTFRYTDRDNSGATSNVGLVTVNVSSENTPPVAVNDTATTTPNQAVSIQVLSNDSDADGTLVTGSIQITVAPAHGTAVPNLDGTVLYTPTTNYFGTDEFQYTVRDEFNDVSNVAKVSLTVTSPSPPWQNPVNPLDVKRDDQNTVSPIDVLLVINELNGHVFSDPATGLLINPPVAPNTPELKGFVDVDGDGFVAPRDALLVINFLNAPPAAQAAIAAEGEPWSNEPLLIGAALDITPRLVLADQPVAVEHVFGPAAPSLSELQEGGAFEMAGNGATEDEPWNTTWDEDLLEMLAASWDANDED